MAYKEVRVARGPLLSCLTCPLCTYLLREATTISECLHTFCRDCITKELSHGESDCCPVCQVTLGTLPLEKLRADHQLNDLKEKLFPTNTKKRKPGLSVNSPGTSNATHRKERSLYSLGVKGPPAVNPGYASRKMRSMPNTGTGTSSSDADEELEEEEGDDDEEEEAEEEVEEEEEEEGEEEEQEEVSDDSPTTILKLSSHNGGPEPKVHPNGELQRGSMAPPWSTSKLSHRLAQSVANGNNRASPSPRIVRGSRKSNGSSNSRPREFPSALDALAQVANADAAMENTGSPSPLPANNRDSNRDSKKVSNIDSKEGVLAKAGSSRKVRPPNGSSLHSRLKQTLNSGPSAIRHKRRPCPGASVAAQASRSSTNGIWFHLESGDLQANEDALPPLSSPYVRIKDGKLPVFHVKTYLVQKLAHKVKTEMEVEITCRGQPVVSSLPLESIRDIWFSAQITDRPPPTPPPPQSQTQPQPQPQPQAQPQAQPQPQALAPGETSTTPASGKSTAEFPTAKDFLMVLTYRRHRKPRIT